MEHWGAARRGASSSQMFKHQQLVHNGEPAQFMFKVVSYHRTALKRQIKEAVRIRRRRGAAGILSSKSEFSRNYIPRQVVEEEDEGAKEERLRMEQEEIREIQCELDREDTKWEQRKEKEHAVFNTLLHRCSSIT